MWPAISGICQHLQSLVTHIIRSDLPNNTLKHSGKEFPAPRMEEKTGSEQFTGDGGRAGPAPGPPTTEASSPLVLHAASS